MWHKPCRTFNPWCLCIKTRCLFNSIFTNYACDSWMQSWWLSGAVTLVTLKIHMYPGGYCQTPVTPRIHRVLSGHRIRICSPLANASVKITKNSATSIEYENWDNIPWPHQILRRNYMKCVTGLSSRPDFKKKILVTLYGDITIKILLNGSNK